LSGSANEASHDPRHRERKGHRHEAEARMGANMLQAEPWLNPAGLLDIAVGGGFVARGTNRRHTLGMLEERLEHVARSVSIVMRVVSNMQPDVLGSEQLDWFSEHLGDLSRFDHFDLDLSSCLGELVEVLGRPHGALSQASHITQLEVDDNTNRIGSASP